MKKTKFILIIFFIILSPNVFSTIFEEQKAFIDIQIENGISYQIKQLRDYIYDVIDKKGGIYTKVQKFIQNKKYKNENIGFQKYNNQKFTREFLIILGGLAALKKLIKINDPKNIDLILFGKYASALLSSNMFCKNYKLNNPQSNGIRTIKELKEIGKLVLSNNKIEIEKKLFLTSSQLRLQSTYFVPVIMIDENAIFQPETFLYALSCGRVLYGLTQNKSFAHGGIFKEPIEIYLHDYGHMCLILTYFFENDEDLYQKTLSYLIRIASKFYQLICEDKIFSESAEEYNRAILIAFYLLHENVIEFISLIPSDDQLDFYILDQLKEKMINTLTSSLVSLKTHLKSPKQKILHKLRFYQLFSDFEIKFEADHASELVRVCPELEQKIYGSKQKDRTLYYNSKKTLKEFKKIIELFSNKIIPYLD